MSLKRMWCFQQGMSLRYGNWQEIVDHRWWRSLRATPAGGTCPCCGHVSAENRQTQSRFACVECGFEENADLVGAINILAAGHAVLACGEWCYRAIQRSKNPPKRVHRGLPFFSALGIAFLQVGEDVKQSTKIMSPLHCYGASPI